MSLISTSDVLSMTAMFSASLKFGHPHFHFFPLSFLYSAPVGYTKLFEYSTYWFLNLTNVVCVIFLYIIITDLLLMVKFFDIGRPQRQYGFVTVCWV